MVQIVVAGRNRASDPAPDFWSSFLVGSVLNSEGRQVYTQKINCRNLKTTLFPQSKVVAMQGAISRLHLSFILFLLIHLVKKVRGDRRRQKTNIKQRKARQIKRDLVLFHIVGKFRLNFFHSLDTLG